MKNNKTMIQDAIKELKAIIDRYEEITCIKLTEKVITVDSFKKNDPLEYRHLFKDVQSMLEWCENNLTEVETKK